MKILILGGTGMLGHRLWSTLSLSHDVYSTVRGSKNILPPIPNIDRSKVYENIDITNINTLESVVDELKPHVVINCIGIIKQIDSSKNYITSIQINSLLPHQISALCKRYGSRFIHFSTDCIFDGKKGNYTEDDIPNALDLYGKSKFLGEISDQDHVLTIRTSIIGKELSPKGSLIDWFLSQSGQVKGFDRAIFSGFPTQTVASILQNFILPNGKLCGTYHLSSNSIDKYSLLNLVKKLFSKDIHIERESSFVIDRSLNSSRLRAAVGDYPVNWDEIISDLYVDNAFYQSL